MGRVDPPAGERPRTPTGGLKRAQASRAWGEEDMGEVVEGVFRCFASGDPAHEVVAAHHERAPGAIRVPESGGELDYPIEKIAAGDEE